MVFTPGSSPKEDGFGGEWMARWCCMKLPITSAGFGLNGGGVGSGMFNEFPVGALKNAFLSIFDGLASSFEGS